MTTPREDRLIALAPEVHIYAIADVAYAESVRSLG